MDIILANVATEAVGAVTQTGGDTIAAVTDFFKNADYSWIGKIVGALALFIIGKWIAKLISKLVARGLGKTSFDDKLANLAGFNTRGVETGIAKFIYYFLLLFVVMAVLNLLGMTEAVDPLKDMFSKFMGYIPNIIGGGILLFLVVFLAKIVKTLLANVMGASRVDERLGVIEGQPITNAVSNGVFAFIILIMLPTVMGAFKLPQISEPLTGLVTKITDNIPNVLTGLVILAVGYMIAKIVKDLVFNMLSAVGFNDFPAKLGYRGQLGTGGKSPAGMISTLVMITIMVTIASQAMSIMNLGVISELSSTFLGGYFNILGAVIILGVAIFAANMAYDALVGKNAMLAKVAKYAILVFAGFIALQRSGIAPDITGLPFQALVIAAAFALGVGGAIALGLGGRETAARWLGSRFQ